MDDGSALTKERHVGGRRRACGRVGTSCGCSQRGLPPRRVAVSAIDGPCASGTGSTLRAGLSRPAGERGRWGRPRFRPAALGQCWTDAHQVMYAPGGGLTVAGHQFAVRHSGYVYGRVVARLAGGDACRRDIAGPGLASWPTRVLPTPGGRFNVLGAAAHTGCGLGRVPWGKESRSADARSERA